MSIFVRASVLAPAPAQAVWARLLDGQQWKTWNPDVEWMVLESDVHPGAYVTIKERGRRQTAYTVEQSVQMTRLVLRLTFGPLARLRVGWTLEPLDKGCHLEGSVQTSGILARWLVNKRAQRIADHLPESLKRLADRRLKPRPPVSTEPSATP